MFEGIKKYVKRVVSKMFPVKSVSEALNVELPVNQDMADRTERWRNMYMDNPPWATSDDWDDFKTAGLPAAIASELARLTTLEMESEITGGSKMAKFLQEQYQPVVESMRVQVEYAAALGGMMLKPYPEDGKIAVDFVQADRFFPVAYNSRGEITSCVFPDSIFRDGYYYTRLELHEMKKGIYTITNRAFRAAKGLVTGSHKVMGEIIPLKSVPEWADLEEVTTVSNVTRPLYSYLKMPFANSVDPNSKLGISVFGRAEGLIRQADELWNAIGWEYEAKEVAIQANAAMLMPTYNGGNVAYRAIPKGKERLYRTYEASKMGDDTFYEVFSPEIRNESYFAGYNKIVQHVEFMCGLAYGTISDPQQVDKTATEIKASKQRSHATVSDMQRAVQSALDDLIVSMSELAAGYKLAPSGDFEVTFDWDDSILVDSETENATLMQEVAADLIKPEIYLMKRYGLESIEQAREMMPTGEEVTQDKGDDLTDLEE